MYSRFTFNENTFNSSPKAPTANFLGSIGLFCFIGICKFAVWQIQEPSSMITRFSKHCFRFKQFILLVQTIKVFSMNYGSCTSSWKPWRWVRLDMILTMRDIYINSNLNPLTKFTSRSRITESKDILPWNIAV